MRVLVACECSGVVRDAFRRLGHEAWSCDLEGVEPGGEWPNYHLFGDARWFIRDGWDLMIAHPPCDYLTISAAWAFKDADFTRYPGVGYHQRVKPGTLTGAARREAREQATEFFLSLWNCGVPRICIENPIGYMSGHPSLPRPQIIQPNQFGEDASKATCLWLRGLPPLRPTGNFPPRLVEWKGKTVRRWSNQTDSGQNRLSPSDKRAAERAVTYAGIAAAMAAQWSEDFKLQAA